MADSKLYDDKQLELVGGKIIDSPDRPRHYYMSQKAIEQRRAANKASAIAKLNNSERVEFTIACAKIGKTADVRDPESMLQAFYDYLELADRMGQRIGNITAYLAMGVRRQQIDDWYDGRTHKDDPRYKELAGYVKAVCGAYREQMGLDGTIHPALTIFWQRNFDGLTNEDIVKVESASPLGEVVDAKTIAEKYKDMPDD